MWCFTREARALGSGLSTRGAKGGELDPERNWLHSEAVRNMAFKIGLELLFRVSPSSPLEVLFDLTGGNEAHGIRSCIWVTSKKAVVKEMWMKHNVTFLICVV
ncbi:MAG: hypothetical protein ABSG35_04770 [Syntrophobacteraceae bacterium]|jgi:hypothetical protein